MSEAIGVAKDDEIVEPPELEPSAQFHSLADVRHPQLTARVRPLAGERVDIEAVTDADTGRSCSIVFRMFQFVPENFSKRLLET